ncbi:NAD(P)H-dependent flavin oxidoreductase [[Mycobacterium] fortunisiensis]|nr:nitronate monooxygenase [[Mycobacterium] fortunisiensis]
MDTFADGRLAATVTRAGGLGVIGAGYRDAEWLDAQFAAAADAPVGVGFIGWRLAEQPHLLDVALAHSPAVVIVSFGDPAPSAAPIRAAGVPLMVQLNDLDEARRAIDLGAQGIIAQGGEAGGHGKGVRSTFTLVPEVADLVADRAPETLLLASGGIADGRGLAAALALGADGALVGSRLWATREAPVAPAARQRVLAARSDDTVRTGVFDIVRGFHWPAGYTGRTLRNDFVRRWLGREDILRAELDEAQRDYQSAVTAADFDVAAIHIGEDVGLIDDIPGTAEVLAAMSRDAATILHRLSGSAN